MRLLSILAASLVVNFASAEMMGPASFPSLRVVNNLKARIAKNPKDAESEYVLGRTYYTLFCSNDPRTIQLYGTESSPRFPSMHTSPWQFKELKPRSDATSVAQIQAAIQHMQRAIKLGGGEPGMYQLTLACAYEASAAIAPKVVRNATVKVFLDNALNAYRASFLEAAAPDEKRGHPQMPATYEKWIATEAGESVLRLSPNDRLKADIVKHQKVMESLPPGPITPIIFSLAGWRTLDQLLDSHSIVRFDLDGTGAAQTYRWVKRDTAFLVWQPNPRIPIRSGRQLFGSATWWVMASDGYAALRLLDDNADGWLTGSEMKGLAIWRDADQNGVAEGNEVVPIGQSSVTGLKVTASGRIGESLVSRNGLRLRDGRLLPTYDWVTRAIAPNSP